MRNFCVWAIDLAILLTGMRNIIFPTDGKRNPRLPDPTHPTDRPRGPDPEPFVMLIANPRASRTAYPNALLSLIHI